MNVPTKIAALPLRQVQDVRSLLVNDQAKQQLAAVAAQHMRPERLMRVVANAIRATPKLQEAEPLSFLGALMQCASLGLEPNTVLGHAFLVPFRNNRKNITEVQVIIGYKGLIDLARRSGHITSISANIHYSDDPLWEYEEGTEARLRHRPGDQDGNKLHAYAIAQFRDGGHAYVVLPWAQIMKIRDGSQNWQSAVKFNATAKSPWATHEDAMAKKTAIRALAKYLPLSVEFMDAVQVDSDLGSRVDYAEFALHPENGPEIDGNFIDDDEVEGEDGPKVNDKKPRDEKRASMKAPAAAASRQDGEITEPTREGDQDNRMMAAFEGIMADIKDADPTAVDDVLDMYDGVLVDIEKMAPSLYAKILDEAKSRKKGPPHR